MKCSSCGCTHLRKVERLLYDGYNSDGDTKLRGETYICMECGHIEIFSSDLLEIAKDAELKENKKKYLKDEAIKEATKKIEKEKNKLPKLMKNLDSLNKEIKELKRKSQNEDITIKQQKLFLKQIEDKEREVETIDQNIYHLQKTIDELKYELEYELEIIEEDYR